MNKLDFKNEMKHALELASKGRGKTSPNPMVGSIVLRGGKIVGEGWHKRCGKDHAEIIALKKAGPLAKGAILLVTLEPCFHFGKTPPCVDAIIDSGIATVVIAMKDPNPLTSGKSIRKLRKAGISVITGILQKEAKQLNEIFVKYITTQKPFVIAKIAQTLDGKIATKTGHSKWITDTTTRQLTHKDRNHYDAILVGINTVLLDDPVLNPTSNQKKLKKIIIDTTLRISSKARLFENVSSKDIYLMTTSKSSITKRNMFEKMGINVMILNVKKNKIDLDEMLINLGREGISSLLLEGGSTTLGEALNQSIVDKLNIYVAPKILGDQLSLSSVVGLNPKKIDEAVNLEDISVEYLNPDILITGYLK